MSPDKKKMRYEKETVLIRIRCPEGSLEILRDMHVHGPQI